MTCTIHLPQQCTVHGHEDIACLECGAGNGQPCDTTASRYGPWCRPACWHDQHRHEGDPR